MPLPTLAVFLHNDMRNSYIKHKVGKVTYTIYLRKGPRAIDGLRHERVLDIAHITSSRPGGGMFRRLEAEIVTMLTDLHYNGIYIESVLNERFERALIKLGYRVVNTNYGTISYYKALTA